MAEKVEEKMKVVEEQSEQEEQTEEAQEAPQKKKIGPFSLDSMICFNYFN